MIEEMTNHLWQSTVFGAMAGLLTLLLRKNHARARYWVWLAASLKFLVPFVLLVALGNHFGWRKPYLHAAAPLAIERFGPVFTPVISASIAAVKPHPISLVPILLWSLWCCGCAAVLLAWCVRWRWTASIIRTAEPLTEGREVEALRRLQAPIEIVSSNARFEPGVFGLQRPILFWPAGISEWLTDAQMEAILAHEVSHVRRRDNLAAAIHMVVEAVFWFHPLVWWIGARLVAERETACDQDVLRLQSEPEVYAEGILKVCEYCLEAPLLCISGVSGSDLKKRIQGIMANRLVPDLGWPRKLLLAIAGMAAIAVPISIGLINAPAGHAQSQPITKPRPEFEVASIKLNKSQDPRMMMGPPTGGRFTVTNMPLQLLITLAYRVQDDRLTGLPSWTTSERWDISAKTDSNIEGDAMWPVVQTLLEGRFQLKFHHETKELPVYALLIAKAAKLQDSKANCASLASGSPGPPQPPAPGKIPCGGIFMFPGRVSGTKTSMDRLVDVLSRLTGRTVIDKTGLVGNYDINLEYTPDQAQAPPPGGTPPGMPMPPPVDPNGPSIFTALQEQLGLKLESQKGPVDILVIDHVEKPSEN